MQGLRGCAGIDPRTRAPFLGSGRSLESIALRRTHHTDHFVFRIGTVPLRILHGALRTRGFEQRPKKGNLGTAER